MPYRYNFPPHLRAGKWDFEIKHAAGEIVEACTATEHDERIIEVLDIIECCENALRDLTGNDESKLQRAYRMHHSKNDARGDYAK